MLFFSLLLFGAVSSKYENTFNIRNSLLNNYHSDLVPAFDDGSSLKINVSVFLMSLTGLDEKLQILTTSIFCYFQWTDHVLRWDEEYEPHRSVGEIYISADKIWIPEVFIVNSVKNMRISKAGEKEYVKANKDGTMLWLPAAEVSTSCSVDLSYYPFDTQVCNIRMEAWYHDTHSFMLKLAGSGFKKSSGHFVENGEWNIVNLSASEYYFSANMGNETIYSGIECTITLQRRYSYHILSTLFPFMTLMVLNVFSIFIPTESDEKMGFCVSNFLTMIVFLTLVDQSMPSSSFHISYLTFLVALQILVSGITIGVVCVCINIQYKKDTDVPPVPIQVVCGPFNSCKFLRHHSQNHFDTRKDICDDDNGFENRRLCVLSWKDIKSRLNLVLNVIILSSCFATLLVLVIISH